MTPSGTQSSFFPKFDELDKIKIVTFCQSEVWAQDLLIAKFLTAKTIALWRHLWKTLNIPNLCTTYISSNQTN